MQDKDLVLDEKLNSFTALIGHVIQNDWQTRKLRPEFEPIQETHIEDFSYDENGPNYTRSSHPISYRENWVGASFILSETIFKTSEYLLLAEFIQKEYPDPNAASRFHQYTFQLFPLLLKNRDNSPISECEALKKKFINEINLRKYRAKAIVNLFGIVLQSREIMIREGLKIRQTTKIDLEYQMKLGASHTFVAIPSAILEIELELKADEHGVLQEQVNRYVKWIRLFGLGSITYNSYKMEFDTISSPSAELGASHQLIHPWRKYYLKKDNEESFLNFLNNLPLSPEFYLFNKDANHMTTAFDRFSESLLENVAVERKITNAIMGIEALLSNDSQELAFKMQTRAAKIMGSFEIEPLVARTHFNKAYSIRSKFAHGGYLTKEKKVELEKIVGPIDNFTATIINYLRILIIMQLTIDISKLQLILLLDDALVDANKEKELRKKLECAKQFLAINHN